MTERWKEGFRAGAKALLALTPDERKIVCLILVLALLGLCAKAWHRNKRPEPVPAASEHPGGR